MLRVEGFNEAVIGTGTRFNNKFWVYDYNKVIKILMDDGMTEEEAIEYFDFNIGGAWVGEETPVFVSIKEEPQTGFGKWSKHLVIENDVILEEDDDDDDEGE
jgi:hypothetical protein